MNQHEFSLLLRAVFPNSALVQYDTYNGELSCSVSISCKSLGRRSILTREQLAILVSQPDFLRVETLDDGYYKVTVQASKEPPKIVLTKTPDVSLRSRFLAAMLEIKPPSEQNDDWHFGRNFLQMIDAIAEFRTWDESYLWKLIDAALGLAALDHSTVLDTDEVKKLREMVKAIVSKDDPEVWNPNAAKERRNAAFKYWENIWYRY
jgi:hypothetical protein